MAKQTITTRTVTRTHSKPSNTSIGNSSKGGNTSRCPTCGRFKSK